MFTKPMRFALNIALDVLFGKKEDFEFTNSTTPDFFYDSNPKTTTS